MPVSNRPLIAVAWIAILAASLPKIILQEVFGYPVSETLQFVMAASVGALGLLLTSVWSRIRSLRPFFGLFLVLIGAEWAVYTKIDQFPVYRTWLNNPSFNVYMLAEQSLRMMVSLLIIATLFAVKRNRSAIS